MSQACHESELCFSWLESAHLRLNERDAEMANSYWFSPAPSEVSSSRISLDFGLRAADLDFRELVVPEVGRIWFVRQLSWPLAALSLHSELQGQGVNLPKPTAICHGIEALACKLEFRARRDEPSTRILGKRAFGRETDEAVWCFQSLCRASHYVRNTHRQAATRAIRVDGGLGFAAGVRFDLLALEPVGRALADAFLDQRVGKGGGSLRNWLTAWLRGNREIPGSPETMRIALSPEHATPGEREIVSSRLLDTSTDASAKRRKLARAIGHPVDLPDIEKVIVTRLRSAGHGRQADEIIAARAFGAVLDRARDATAELTSIVESGRGGIPILQLARDASLREALRTLRDAAENFRSKADVAKVAEPLSMTFADAITTAQKDADAIRLLVKRAGDVLSLADDFVTRGPLFRIVDKSESLEEIEDGASRIEPDITARIRTGRTFRIANLHTLMRDITKGGEV